MHTLPRFKYKGVAFWFILVPSDECHFECIPANFEWSLTSRIPYPKIAVFAQSLLDTNDESSLEDLIDGMDLTKEWGEDHLNLEGTIDTEWVQRRNLIIRETVPWNEDGMYELSDWPFPRSEIWEEILSNKQRRIGQEHPPGLFVTQYRPLGSGDPRLRHGWLA